MRPAPLHSIYQSIVALCFLALPVHARAAEVATAIGPIVGGKHGMVVSSSNEAARVGAAVLADGGNAVDAAIAVQFALGVAEPGYSGIGGGGFMLVYEAATDEVTVFDSRERAPASARPKMFLKKNGEPIAFAKRRTLGVAVGVPGALAGIEAARLEFGTRPLAELIAPSIELAEHGVIVSRLMAASLREHEAVLAANPAASARFLPGGEPLAIGDLLVQPELADTLRLIAEDGIDAFYRGPIGEAFVAEVDAAGGGMTMADLKKYAITRDEPVRGNYGVYELVTVAPPSSGGLTVLQMLALLDRLDLGQYPEDSSLRYHAVLKAMHLAFADRNAWLGDPEFVDIPLAGWLAPKYIKQRAALIDFDADTCPIPPGALAGAAPALAPLEFLNGDPQTTHVDVADRWGNLVAFTVTIEQHYGTGRLLPGHGFFLNNELTDFDPLPGRPNSPAPNKRPLSSMAPTLVLQDGQPAYVIGSPGGPRIIAAVAQVLLDLLEYDLDLEHAIARPRVFAAACDDKIRWEADLSPAVRSELEQLGHRFRDEPLEVGDVGLIAIEGDTYVGVADPRRDGVAVGLTRAD
ncbi:gamma-glutamyltransferase [Nannocystis bainbridge]|uniref:Glutathione hydrolase proenzyme n=1 Tax=Nannocystis bainbridge TaxID=2995303 RepID=A0ABT5E7D8_9BACT|nr:gamma-glutamyltransferase [Nannocystis bainbridge]MDC0721239.1 gamma-glutamyltransferase [Nannocystis bainbridge]